MSLFNLTGDYDVIAGFSIYVVNRILAAMHAGNRLPHSLSLRVDDTPPPTWWNFPWPPFPWNFPDPAPPLGHAPQPIAWHPPRIARPAVDTYGNAVANPVLTASLFANAAASSTSPVDVIFQNLDPVVNYRGGGSAVAPDFSMLAGVAQLQLGPPTIELDNANSTAAFRTPVMVRYLPDPDAEALPPFMRGEVVTTLGVSEISAQGGELIDVGLVGNQGDIHFNQFWPAQRLTGHQLDNVNLALRNSLQTSFQPANAKLPQDVLNMQFKSLPDRNAVAALMNMVGGDPVTAPSINSVSEVWLNDDDDFAITVTADLILKPFYDAVNSALETRRIFSGSVPVDTPGILPGFNVLWTVAIGAPTIELQDTSLGLGDILAHGSGQILLTIPVVGTFATDNSSFSIQPTLFEFLMSQAFTLSLNGGEVGIQTLNSLTFSPNPAVTPSGVPDNVDVTYWGYTVRKPIGDFIRGTATNLFNQAWGAAQSSVQTQVGKSLGVDRLQNFFGSLINQPPNPKQISPPQQVTPVLTYTSFEIRLGGIILHGQLTMAQPFGAPVLAIDFNPWTANDPHPEYSALNTWIPGGTIWNYVWSYWGVAQPPDWNTFISSNAPPFWLPRMCLTVTGARKSSSGQIVDEAVTATSCWPIFVPNLFSNGRFANWDGLLPSFATTSIASDGKLAITGHMSPWTAAGPTVNLLAYFPDDHDLHELHFLTRALAESQRTDTATAILCVLAPGQLEKAKIPAGMIVADDAKGWESLLQVHRRPALHLLGPAGNQVWGHHGPLNNVELTGALKKHLQPGGRYIPRTVEPSLRVGMRAPNFIFAYPSGQETTLRKLAGQGVILVFWRSDSSVSLGALGGMIEGCRAMSSASPVVLAIDDGEDSGYAHGLAAGHSHSAVIVPDPGRLISGAYGIAMWPTAVILDADGIVQHIGLGLHEKERVR